MSSHTGRGDIAIRRPLRAWLGVEVAFGIAAILTIFLRPDDTDSNFAWPIAPTVMAAVLGAFYLASASLFVMALFAKKWQKVRVMVIPTAVFSFAMLVTTVIHWDKFSVGSGPFYVWLASYALPPPIFISLYIWHQRDSSAVGADINEPMLPAARSFFRINGLGMAAVAIAVYVTPEILIDIAPWEFTPLTARTLSGWLIGLGLLQFWMSLEADWGRAKLATAMLMVLPFSLLVQLLRYGSQVDWSNVALWVLAIDVAAMGVLSAYLWATSGGQE